MRLGCGIGRGLRSTAAAQGRLEVRWDNSKRPPDFKVVFSGLREKTCKFKLIDSVWPR